MHMIRHDDERNHDDPFAFKMPQSFRDDLGTFAPPQETGAMSGIEPALDRAGKALMIFALDLVAPRFRMKPSATLRVRSPIDCAAVTESRPPAET